VCKSLHTQQLENVSGFYAGPASSGARHAHQAGSRASDTIWATSNTSSGSPLSPDTLSARARPRRDHGVEATPLAASKHVRCRNAWIVFESGLPHPPVCPSPLSPPAPAGLDPYRSEPGALVDHDGAGRLPGRVAAADVTYKRRSGATTTSRWSRYARLNIRERIVMRRMRGSEAAQMI